MAQSSGRSQESEENPSGAGPSRSADGDDLGNEADIDLDVGKRIFVGSRKHIRDQ